MDVRRRRFTEYERGMAQPGLYAPWLPQCGHAAITLVAGRTYLGRFQADADRTIARLAFIVSTAAGADDAVDIGILDSAYTPLATAGSTTGKLTSTGVKTVDLSTAYTLEAGRIYYAAFSVISPFGGTAGAVIGTNGVSNVGDLFGTIAGLRETAAQTVKFPIGSTTLSPVATPLVPILALRES